MYLREALPSSYEVLCCSLFLHHLDESDAISLLRRMAAAAQNLVLVDDLVRGYSGISPRRDGLPHPFQLEDRAC